MIEQALKELQELKAAMDKAVDLLTKLHEEDFSHLARSHMLVARVSMIHSLRQVELALLAMNPVKPEDLKP